MTRTALSLIETIAFLLVLSIPAQAAIVNYTGVDDAYTGIIPIGQSGNIDLSSTEISSATHQQTGGNGIFGFLSPYSILSFTFNYPLTGLERVDNAIYGAGGLHTSLAGTPTNSFDVVSIGTPLVIAQSGLSSNSFIGSGQLINGTGFTLPFSQWIQESLGHQFVAPGTITYAATALPLPPSLSLFVLAILVTICTLRIRHIRAVGHRLKRS